MNNTKRTMKEMEYEDLVSLLEYLEEKHQDKAQLILDRFFPDLDAEQTLEFNNVCAEILNKGDGKELFEKFKEAHPDATVDPEGKSEPVKKDFWKITLKGLEELHTLASENLKATSFKDDTPFHVDTQVVNARSLAPLINMETSTKQYLSRRVLFLKKYESDLINKKVLNKYEEILKQLVGNVNLLSRLLSYCETRNYGEYRFFVKHVFNRLDCLHQDTELSDQRNVDFLENIKKIKE